MDTRRQHGFSLFELIVVVVIISLLAVVFARRLAVYQEFAEKAAMDATLSIIKTALQIRLANLIIDNRQADAAELERTNPMEWLAEKPSNYVGLYQEPAERGSWYYDQRLLQLVYVPRSADYLRMGERDGDREIRFRTRLIFDRVQVAGMHVNSVTGVALIPVQPYRWTPTITHKLWS